MIRSGGRSAGEPSSQPHPCADPAWNHEIGAIYRFWVMSCREGLLEEKQGRCQTTGARCILIRIRRWRPQSVLILLDEMRSGGPPKNVQRRRKRTKFLGGRLP